MWTLFFLLPLCVGTAMGYDYSPAPYQSPSPPPYQSPSPPPYQSPSPPPYQSPSPPPYQSPSPSPPPTPYPSPSPYYPSPSPSPPGYNYPVYGSNSKWFQPCQYDSMCEGVCDGAPELDTSCEDYQFMQWEEICLFCEINLSPFLANSCPNGGICICGPAFLNWETCSTGTDASDCWNAECRGDD